MVQFLFTNILESMQYIDINLPIQIYARSRKIASEHCYSCCTLFWHSYVIFV